MGKVGFPNDTGSKNSSFKIQIGKITHLYQAFFKSKGKKCGIALRKISAYNFTLFKTVSLKSTSIPFHHTQIASNPFAINAFGCSELSIGKITSLKDTIAECFVFQISIGVRLFNLNFIFPFFFLQTNLPPQLVALCLTMDLTANIRLGRGATKSCTYEGSLTQSR